MSDTAVTDEPTATAQVTPGDLLDNLLELGQALPVSSQPNAHTAAPLVAGLIYYLATGSLVPPRVEVPDQAAINAELADTTALNAERARVAELERQLKATTAGPAAVAPAPIAPVEPEPTAPAETETPPASGMFADQAAEANAKKAADLRAQAAELEAGGSS